MNTLYVKGNFVNVNTLFSVTSEDAAYVKEWMYNRRQSKPFRFMAKSGNQILIGDGVTRISPTIAAIMNHNLAGTSGGGAFLWKIKGDDNNPPGGGWDAPAYSRDITWHTLNMFKLLDGAPSYYYWLLDIDDFDNALAGCNIGEFILSTWAAFPRNYAPGSRNAAEYIQFDNETPYKQRWRAFGAKRKTFNISFHGITNAQMVSEMEAMFDDLDGIHPFIFIPDSTEPDCWYVECPDILTVDRECKNINNFSLDLFEQTRGITIP